MQTISKFFVSLLLLFLSYITCAQSPDKTIKTAVIQSMEGLYHNGSVKTISLDYAPAYLAKRTFLISRTDRIFELILKID